MDVVSDLCSAVKVVVDLGGKENVRINARQCELLAKKASWVLRVLGEIQSVFLGQEAIEDEGEGSRDWTRAGLELRRVVKDAEVLIRDCCCDEQWLEVAIKRGNLKETFAAVLYDLEWHTSVLCTALVRRKKSDSGDVFDRSACEGKLGVTEEFMLSSAVKQDRQSLRELIRGSHVCDRETCKADPCLVAKFLEKLDAEEKELDRSAILGKSQSPLFLWVSSEDLEIGRHIGGGGSADVAEVTWLGQRFAIKTLKYGTAFSDIFRQEIAAMAGLDHPHLVRVVCCLEDNRNLSIVMELMYKSLFDVLGDCMRGGATAPFPIIQSVDLMLQIGEGVRYLHSKSLAHRDLKSLNVLLQFADPRAIEDSISTVPVTDSTVNPFIAKIADFGLTKVKHASTAHQTPNVGSRAWMPPELLNIPDIDSLEPSPRFRPMKMDAYSFGMVCYEILSGKCPFAEIKPSLRNELVKGGTRPTLPNYTPKPLAVMIQRCWDGNSRRRPDFPTICTVLRYIKGLLLQGESGASKEQTRIARGPVFDLHSEIKVQGPWGGNGGGPFFDGVATSIKQMKLKYDENQSPCIWYIEMKYDVNGTSFDILAMVMPIMDHALNRLRLMSQVNTSHRLKDGPAFYHWSLEVTMCRV